MTHPAALLRFALCLGSLVAVPRVPARAQVLRVVAGDRELARGEMSDSRGYLALPLTLLTALGAEVIAGPGAVVVRLFGDTLLFYPGRPAFHVNGGLEPLNSWTYQEEGVLFVAQWFFTSWLPRRYPERLTYRDGALWIAAPPQPLAAARPVPAGDTTRAAAAPRPVRAEPPGSARRRDPDDPVRGGLLGFIDARVSGVFDSNVDYGPVPRRSYGTVARFGVGIQSARSRPFLMARYDFALNRFANAEKWNRTTHDISIEVAPSLPPIRLRLAAAVRIGSWTEDRQPANQILLGPHIEIRPSPVHLLDVYVVQSARRIDLGVTTRTDTFRLAGMGYFLWWHGGGLRVDGRYEVNASEFDPSRFVGWTGYSWMRIPLVASHRLTLQAAYNRRRYAHAFVDQAGTVARGDRRWTVSASLTSEFAREAWQLGLEYEFEDNVSNNAYAVYQAHRVEFTVRRRW